LFVLQAAKESGQKTVHFLGSATGSKCNRGAIVSDDDGVASGGAGFEDAALIVVAAPVAVDVAEVELQAGEMRGKPV